MINGYTQCGTRVVKNRQLNVGLMLKDNNKLYVQILLWNKIYLNRFFLFIGNEGWWCYSSSLVQTCWLDVVKPNHHTRLITRRKKSITWFFSLLSWFIFFSHIRFYKTVKKKVATDVLFLCHLHFLFFCIRVRVYLVFERKHNKQKNN
jgi:hypothetical protein